MLNLASPAYDAIQKLKNNPDWRCVVDALADQQSTLMHAALDCPIESRVDIAGYARGVRDVVSMFLLYEKPTRGGPAPKATVKVKENV